MPGKSMPEQLSPHRPGDAEPVTSLGRRKIVVLGGGSGISVVLRGLRAQVTAGLPLDITAVVSTADDGGSSGRLRRERGGLPPGDLRRCLLALARRRATLWAKLFDHRFRGNGDLGGHALGNLILVGLAEREGCYLRALEQAASLLETCGVVLPVSLDPLVLRAESVEGETLAGESAIGNTRGALRRVWLEPQTVEATPGVVERIREADLVVVGPGSLFTSLLPVLLVGGVAEAVRGSRGRRVLVANLMTQPGETLGMDLGEHLHTLDRHVGPGLVDSVLVPDRAPAGPRLGRYLARGSVFLDPEKLGRRPERVVRADLMTASGKLRHDPKKLVRTLLNGFLAGTGRGAGSVLEKRL